MSSDQGMQRRGIASLAMYPFPSVRWAYDRCWEAVTDRLEWVPATLDWHLDPPSSWTDERLVVSQACGWPLVTELRDRVRVVGTFVAATPEAEGYSYRSVLVARAAGDLDRLAGSTAAVNGFDSLSGWVSLVAAVHGSGARWEGDIVLTGAHLDSLRAVRDGRAEIASIDSVTWWHAHRNTPSLVEDLVVVGYGPLVPCLPIITAATTSDDELRELRVAMIDAVDDPLVEPAARAIAACGFVPLDLAHYLPLRQLAPAAANPSQIRHGLHSTTG